MSESENSKKRWIKHVPMGGIPPGVDDTPADLLSGDFWKLRNCSKIIQYTRVIQSKYVRKL